ncbi:unnamed protein product [Lactuca virosa]|uniref:Uncharacterized protein n=1 Tax=Lactuca virosa TaxID=75947 RepID=A0AAU9MQ46_9ASTR|nr:unnamed protein product [Lactuca virosa]
MKNCQKFGYYQEMNEEHEFNDCNQKNVNNRYSLCKCFQHFGNQLLSLINNRCWRRRSVEVLAGAAVGWLRETGDGVCLHTGRCLNFLSFYLEQLRVFGYGQPLKHRSLQQFLDTDNH